MENAKSWNAQADIINALRQHSEFYQFKPAESVVKKYAEKLESISIGAIKKALDEIAENAGSRFPTLGDIKSIARSHAPSKVELEDIENKKKYQDEEKRFIENKTRIIKSVGQEAYDKYFNYWFKEFLGEDLSKELSEYGLTKNIFQKSAVFDLVDAQMNIPNAIKIMQRKSAQIKKKNREESGMFYA